MHPLIHIPLLLMLWNAAAAALPQQGVTPPVLTGRTDLVTLSVTVMDRSGAFVSGLRQEHFTVYDDGQRQPIQFFTRADVAATIGLLIDSSGSMRGRQAEVMTAAAAFAVVRHPGDEFFTVNFNETTWFGLPPRVLFTGEIDPLRAALSTAPARGLTALYDALDRGLSHLELGSRERRALIVISDGGDNASAHSLEAVVAHARRTNAVIYSVTFPDPDNRDANRAVLKTLARETGGEVFSPRRNEDVLRCFMRIAQEIRRGYLIGFAPAETSHASFRIIRVTAAAGDRRRLVVRTRAGYYAEPASALAR